MVYQKHQKEIERIENIIGGGYDPTCIEAHQEQLKREEYEESLREIERKHLRGLLSHEEASIARIKLFEANQAKFEQHKKEREKMFEELAEWKKEQNELISEKVNRVHEMEVAAIKAKDKLLEQKQERAKQIDEESKRIAAKIADERQAELQRKIDMISEIRSLQVSSNRFPIPGIVIFVFLEPWRNYGGSKIRSDRRNEFWVVMRNVSCGITRTSLLITGHFS